MKSRGKKKVDKKAREDGPVSKVLGEGNRSRAWRERPFPPSVGPLSVFSVPRRGSFFLFSPILLAILLSIFSCDLLGIDGADARSGELLLVSYNVQNLFDAVSDGGEYPEFDPESSSWSERSFHTKLSHIADVLNAIIEKEDFICILQEIENRNALRALAEKVDSGREALFLYISDCLDSVTHVAVLSNLEAVSIRGHSYAGTEKRPRLILELEFDVSGERLIVFGNHWKSKYGGAEETEAERRAAAGILKQRIVTLLREEPAADIVVMGDLNEEPDEYEKNGGAYQTALMPYQNPAARGAGVGGGTASAAFGNEDACLLLSASPEHAGLVGEDLVLYSTWTESDEEGTYFYQGDWERIDHALLCPGLFDDRGLGYRSFEVFTDDFILDSEGRPLASRRGEGDGYSDHLAVLIRLEKP